jgi:hypothetical protein
MAQRIQEYYRQHYYAYEHSSQAKRTSAYKQHFASYLQDEERFNEIVNTLDLAVRFKKSQKVPSASVSSRRRTIGGRKKK